MGIIAGEGALAAGRIAATGGFNLDYIGAVIGQQPGAERGLKCRRPTPGPVRLSASPSLPGYLGPYQRQGLTPPGERHRGLPRSRLGSPGCCSVPPRSPPGRTPSSSLFPVTTPDAVRTSPREVHAPVLDEQAFEPALLAREINQQLAQVLVFPATR